MPERQSGEAVIHGPVSVQDLYTYSASSKDTKVLMAFVSEFQFPRSVAKQRAIMGL